MATLIAAHNHSQIQTPINDKYTRDHIFDLLMKMIGDAHIAIYILDQLVSTNDQEARAFHTSLRGAWSLYDKSNKPEFIKACPPSLKDRVLSTNQEYSQYKLSGNEITNIKSRARKGFGWKLKSMPLDLAREIEFHSSDNYWGMCLMDRKPNVASYICRDETIEDYNALRHLPWGGMFITDIKKQIEKSLVRVAKNYRRLIRRVCDGTVCGCGCEHCVKDGAYRKSGPISKITLDNQYELWVLYSLIGDRERYEMMICEKLPDYSNNPYLGDGSYASPECESAILVLGADIVDGKVVFDKPDYYHQYSFDENDKPILIECEYSNEEFEEAFGIKEDKVEDWPLFFKERFGYDIHNRALYDLSVDNMKHLVQSSNEVFGILSVNGIADIKNNDKDDEEWELLYEKYGQTIKDITIARLLNEEERLRDKWFDFVNIGHITINGGNLPRGNWQVSELFEDVSRIFRNY